MESNSTQNDPYEAMREAMNMALVDGREGLKGIEAECIKTALIYTRGNQAKAALLLGMSIRFVINKVKLYGLSEFKKKQKPIKSEAKSCKLCNHVIAEDRV